MKKNHIKKVFPCINIEHFFIHIYKNIIFETILKTFALKKMHERKRSMKCRIKIQFMSLYDFNDSLSAIKLSS